MQHDSRRLHPPWWDHQRHVLSALRQAIDHSVATDLQPKSGDRIVDLGCGDRPYASLFHERGCDYVACDLEGDVDVRLESGKPVPLPDRSADGVVSFQVLEHVWDLDWYLGECRRILKPGGWLLLSTHGTWLYHPHPTDFRRWTRDGLIGELEHRRLVVRQARAIVGPLAWTTQFRLLGIRDVLRRIPIVGPALLAPICVLMNVRMAIEDAITPAAIRDANACVYVTVSRRVDDDKGA